MTQSQIELLVLYQDIDLMLKEAEDEAAQMGFPTEGKQKLEDARQEIAKKIDPRFLRTYERLRSRYNHSIAPVQNDTCLGCFARLPTSYSAKGRHDESIFTCEQCGRILYWLE